MKIFLFSFIISFFFTTSCKPNFNRVLLRESSNDCLKIFPVSFCIYKTYKIDSNTEIIERTFMTVGISQDANLLNSYIFSNSAREETLNTYNTKLETSIN